jgi:hypothetical protein
MGLDAKTYWLTDRQTQCNFDFDLSQMRLDNSIGELGRVLEGRQSKEIEKMERRRHSDLKW